MASAAQIASPYTGDMPNGRKLPKMSILDLIRAQQTAGSQEQMTHKPFDKDAWKPFKKAGSAVKGAWEGMSTQEKAELIASMNPVTGPPIAVKDTAKYATMAGSELMRGEPIEAAKSGGLAAISALGVLPFVPAMGGMIGGKSMIPYEAMMKASEMKKAGKSVDEIFAATSGITPPGHSGVYTGHPDFQPRVEFPDEGVQIHPQGKRDWSVDMNTAKRDNPKEYSEYIKLKSDLVGKTEESMRTGKYTVDEIADAESELKTLGKKIGIMPEDEYFQLENFMDHPEFFKNYPELKKIEYMEGGLPKGTLGSYQSGMNVIRINPNAPKLGMMKTATHEMQHAIQHFDDLAKGGNSEQFFDEILAENQVLKKRFGELKGFLSESPNMPVKMRKNMIDELSEIQLLKSNQKNVEREAYKRYKALHGEEEARLVEKRLLFPQNVREQRPFYKEYEHEKKMMKGLFDE